MQSNYLHITYWYDLCSGKIWFDCRFDSCWRSLEWRFLFLLSHNTLGVLWCAYMVSRDAARLQRKQVSDSLCDLSCVSLALFLFSGGGVCGSVSPPVGACTSAFCRAFPGRFCLPRSIQGQQWFRCKWTFVSAAYLISAWHALKTSPQEMLAKHRLLTVGRASWDVSKA